MLAGKGDVDGAEKYYLRAFEIDPTSAKPHVGLAILFEGKGDLNGAEKHHRIALEIEPQFANGSLVDVLKNKARALDSKSGDLEAAESLL